MPNGSLMLAMVVSGLALSVSPGPSMFYVLSRSVGQSRSAGLASALGLAVGGVILALLSALGLTAVVDRWPVVLPATQIVGGLYLAYLGIEMFREARQAETLVPTELEEDSLGRIFRQGVLVEALNPKTALFLISFVPQFVDPNGGDTRWQLIILGMLVPLTAVPADVFVSFCGGAVADRYRSNAKVGVLLNWIAATILLGLSMKVLWSALG